MRVYGHTCICIRLSVITEPEGQRKGHNGQHLPTVLLFDFMNADAGQCIKEVCMWGSR